MIRLRSSQEIQEVFRRGKRLRGDFVNLLYCSQKEVLRAQGSAARWAVAVGKKFGQACERNLAKRIVREEVRALKDFPIGFDCVVEILPRARGFNRKELHQAVNQVIAKSKRSLREMNCR